MTMMSGRPGRVPLQFLPNEARSLPPPKLTDPRLVYMGFLGYCSGLIDNAIRRRPVVSAGEGCAGWIGWEEWGSRGSGPAPPQAARGAFAFQGLSPKRPRLAFLRFPCPLSSSASGPTRASLHFRSNRGCNANHDLTVSL